MKSFIFLDILNLIPNGRGGRMQNIFLNIKQNLSTVNEKYGTHTKPIGKNGKQN